MIIAVDFDGTMTTHAYPGIGKSIGAVPVLKDLMERDHQIILWTMRSGDRLQQAVKWCEDNGIRLWGINNNPDQSIWTSSPKAYADLYIDDSAVGTPLKINGIKGTRPFVDWKKMRELLVEKNIL